MISNLTDEKRAAILEMLKWVRHHYHEIPVRAFKNGVYQTVWLDELPRARIIEFILQWVDMILQRNPE